MSRRYTCTIQTMYKLNIENNSLNIRKCCTVCTFLISFFSVLSGFQTGGTSDTFTRKNAVAWSDWKLRANCQGWLYHIQMYISRCFHSLVTFIFTTPYDNSGFCSSAWCTWAFEFYLTSRLNSQRFLIAAGFPQYVLFDNNLPIFPLLFTFPSSSFHFTLPIPLPLISSLYPSRMTVSHIPKFQLSKDLEMSHTDNMQSVHSSLSRNLAKRLSSSHFSSVHYDHEEVSICIEEITSPNLPLRSVHDRSCKEL